jgi:hypothetical protein
MDIPSQYGIEPNGAILAHNYISNNGGVGCNKTIFTKLGMFPLNCEYGCHKNATFVLQFNSYYVQH